MLRVRSQSQMRSCTLAHTDGRLVAPGLRGRGLATRLIAAAEAEAAARGCSQTVHPTYAFQARALYERNGYELAGCVQDFPSGTDVLWYHKHLKARADKR